MELYKPADSFYYKLNGRLKTTYHIIRIDLVCEKCFRRCFAVILPVLAKSFRKPTWTGKAAPPDPIWRDVSLSGSIWEIYFKKATTKNQKKLMTIMTWTTNCPWRVSEKFKTITTKLGFTHTRQIKQMCFTQVHVTSLISIFCSGTVKCTI